ncbi:hypothetical protein ACQPZX_04725 [Actinoplanes sp. CA-142083]|uniref:hypothetical protein n=1 Tax=Actinoplanes sp. CA-142083 TaxID=3239903 RepID=UPI003D8F91E2
MGLAFALGSACFVVGPFPGYAGLVGATADAVTFFVGSVLFTTGGALQVWTATGRAAWWAAVIQSAGTLFFNVSTFRALHTALSSPGYDRLVWRPDLYGSICFLVSGVVAYRASPRDGRWSAAVNLLGCVLFGVSAITAFVLPDTGTSVDETIANVTTSAGAACFLACAIGVLKVK